MLLPLNKRGVQLINFMMSVLQNLPLILYMMAKELQLLAESWSEETEAEMSQRPEQDRPEADPDPSPIPERRPPQQRRRGIRHCLVADCNATFNGCSPMARHILVSHCQEGIERADRMVRFLREIARSLHLLHEGRDDERVLDELRALVRRGFRPVLWEFGGKMVPVCQRFSSAVGPGATDPDGPGAGWAGVDCAPRNVGSPPGDSPTSQPAIAGGNAKGCAIYGPAQIGRVRTLLGLG